MCQALLGFEREVGSLETFEAALERCAAQMNRVKERREKVNYWKRERRGLLIIISEGHIYIHNIGVCVYVYVYCHIMAKSVKASYIKTSRIRCSHCV